MEGILNIHKPSGWTSHDVVKKVRSIVKEKRVGHTGTLDPLATGVLVLCVGRATRIARYLEAGEKEYRAVMQLGVVTDTQDADGRVLETRMYTPPDRDSILRVLRSFTGEIMQRPPLYSAIKVGGIPSYRLARQGKARPLKPRKVTVYTSDISDYSDPSITIAVRCSKGVYIRTLCADIGDALGMGAHLTSLVRTRSGRFSIGRALTIDQLSEAAAAGNAEDALVPIDEALDELSIVTIGDREAQRVKHGNRVPWTAPSTNGEAGPVRVYGPEGGLLAVARIGSGVLRPELVF